ncbi:hypothetical protein KR018_003466 [Drosophila ironensis]|nr:hypothetical protein KR018_003466 [Drosophila ironensis]
MSDLDWDDENYVDPPPMEAPRREDDGSGRGRRNRDNPRRTNQSSQGAFFDTIAIASDMIGRFIGKAGSNITRIQNDFNVSIKVDKLELVVRVSGSQQTDVSDAMNVVRRQISSSSRGEHASRPERDTREGFGNSRNLYNFQPSFPGQGSSHGGDLTGTIDWDALNKASKLARDARWAALPPLTKDFYKEDPEVAHMSQAEVERFRDENNKITVAHVFEPKDGESLPPIPNPVTTFEQCFSEYPDLLGELQKKGFEKPSPIQAQAWPVLLKGHDMIGIAQTGTGKTLAFLLPGMIHTEFQSLPRGERGGANVLILAPTRELALQIETEVQKYSFRNMKAVCVYGGGDRRMQISDLERGAEIIICTPGRLNDLVLAKVIDVSSVTYLVLDEADRMLDMGFEPQIRKILLDIRPDRQTIMTSATWPPGVRRLAQSYMSNPIQVCVGSLDLAATHSVKQVINILERDEDKYAEIKKFVSNMTKTDKIIIFCGKKARADDLSSDLTLDGFFTQCIHGNRDQSDREQAIADIKSGEVRILVATDVASRGLDIEDITHVINYDFPRNIEEYVHRVGRTGRAGRSGTSISFFTRDDWAMAKELITILQEAEQEVPDELHNMARRFKAMKDRRAATGGGPGDRRFGGGRRFGDDRRYCF